MSELKSEYSVYTTAYGCFRRINTLKSKINLYCVKRLISYLRKKQMLIKMEGRVCKRPMEN